MPSPTPPRLATVAAPSRRSLARRCRTRRRPGAPPTPVPARRRRRPRTGDGGRPALAGPDPGGLHRARRCPTSCSSARVAGPGRLPDRRRFRIDQVRAGDIEPFTYDGLVDVRYGIDTKYLERRAVPRSAPASTRRPACWPRRCALTEPLFGGDDVIGVAESDVDVPGARRPGPHAATPTASPVDASVLGPLPDSKGGLLRRDAAAARRGVRRSCSASSPLRWMLTGVGKGVGSVVHTASETPRGARRLRTARSAATSTTPAGARPSELARRVPTVGAARRPTPSTGDARSAGPSRPAAHEHAARRSARRAAGRARRRRRPAGAGSGPTRAAWSAPGRHWSVL